MDPFPDLHLRFTSREELVEHIELGLQESAPANWRISRGSDGMSWVVEDPVPSPSPGFRQFGVFATGDLNYVMVTYGNTDAGDFSKFEFMSKAMLIDTCGAKNYGVASYFGPLFENLEPNVVGMT